MNEKTIAARLAQITALAKDNMYDEAHIQQDSLFIDVLLTIASGAPDAAELARETLKVLEIRFKRYYA